MAPQTRFSFAVIVAQSSFPKNVPMLLFIQQICIQQICIGQSSEWAALCEKCGIAGKAHAQNHEQEHVFFLGKMLRMSVGTLHFRRMMLKNHDGSSLNSST